MASCIMITWNAREERSMSSKGTWEISEAFERWLEVLKGTVKKKEMAYVHVREILHMHCENPKGRDV